MNAGLPGIGIASLFFVISALLMPVVELARTVRGQSSRERWRGVAHDWLLAVAMVGAFLAMGWAVAEKVPEPMSRALRGGVGTGSSTLLLTLLVLTALLLVPHTARLTRVDHRRSRGATTGRGPVAEPQRDD